MKIETIRILGGKSNSSLVQSFLASENNKGNINWKKKYEEHASYASLKLLCFIEFLLRIPQTQETTYWQS